jgi:hypothetical protein
MVAAQALWVIFLSAVIAGKLIHLPGANMMQTFAILISIYIPIGFVIGWLISEIIGKVKGQILKGMSGVIILLIAIFFAFGQRGVSQPFVYTYVTRPDVLAMAWIKDNLPADARFFVEGVTYNYDSIIGSDAGWWIPLFTGRENSMPPQYALLNEAPINPDYTMRMNDLVKSLQTISINSPQFISMLCGEGISHVYIGQEQGWAALKWLGSPQLFSPASLLDSPAYTLVYHNDRVYIFRLNSRVCT